MVGPSFGCFGAALTNWVTVTLNAYISINHALEEQSTGDPVKLLVEERPISVRNQDMDIGQVITFHFLRNDGRRERTKLDHYDLAQARILVEQVFRMGNEIGRASG